MKKEPKIPHLDLGMRRGCSGNREAIYRKAIEAANNPYGAG